MGDAEKKASLFWGQSPRIVACKLQNNANLYGGFYNYIINMEKQSTLKSR
jgi:hypothetical protein